MSLEEFLHNLQFNINRANQPNWEVDWEDAPLPYKLYRGLRVVPLSTEVPLSLPEGQPPLQPDVERIGHFLWYVYGIIGVSQSVHPDEYQEEAAYPIHSYRRFAPSGGALYPNELYLYLKLEDLPDGIYHYDAAHHRLVLLREGDIDSYVERALGNRCEISTCFATAFVSTRFWKNFFKYNNLSYRLQGLDAGVLMGQLLETAKRFGFESGVYVQFLDSAINHLLGLTEDEESVYSVVPLSVAATNWGGRGMERAVTAEELCRELPAISLRHYEKSEKVWEFPRLLEVNEASKLDCTGGFQKVTKQPVMRTGEKEIHLPEIESGTYDFVDACKKRHSPEMDFVMGKVSQEQLAALLKRATHSYSFRSDLDNVFDGEAPRVSIYGCLYNVEGIPNGAYAYDSGRHSLWEIGTGDYRLHLQSGLSLDNVNLLQVPLCLHIIGKKDYFQDTLGYRGYRIMQMEAGMLVQRLLLSSAACGFGGHPLLGFDTAVTDGVYRLDSENLTTLIQIPIGPFREKAWLRGSLLS
ncbi:SagB family peptide dehydrogenase [Rossellomorea aquimaris]|uniref:SagB-type dehydrogenase family enzyme n=1 Tax=Rossellomorea aquimaris TaxID=189382 RepID=A0A366EPY4_9BACI|nr:SagB family peptide dehydrogenase [Rossellomorea aquimaris]RBP04473.1 SagB-type dehydrogenase family enzyme [Rossellomorea aquimaris]